MLLCMAAAVIAIGSYFFHASTDKRLPILIGSSAGMLLLQLAGIQLAGQSLITGLLIIVTWACLLNSGIRKYGLSPSCKVLLEKLMYGAIIIWLVLNFGQSGLVLLPPGVEADIQVIALLLVIMVFVGLGTAFFKKTSIFDGLPTWIGTGANLILVTILIWMLGNLKDFLEIDLLTERPFIGLVLIILLSGLIQMGLKKHNLPDSLKVFFTLMTFLAAGIWIYFNYDAFVGNMLAHFVLGESILRFLIAAACLGGIEWGLKKFEAEPVTAALIKGTGYFILMLSILDLLHGIMERLMGQFFLTDPAVLRFAGLAMGLGVLKLIISKLGFLKDYEAWLHYLGYFLLLLSILDVLEPLVANLRNIQNLFHF